MFVIFLFCSFYEGLLETGGEINGVFPKPSRWNNSATCLVGNFLFWYGQNAEDLNEWGQKLFPIELRKMLARPLTFIIMIKHGQNMTNLLQIAQSQSLLILLLDPGFEFPIRKVFWAKATTFPIFIYKF